MNQLSIKSKILMVGLGFALAAMLICVLSINIQEANAAKSGVGPSATSESGVTATIANAGSRNPRSSVQDLRVTSASTSSGALATFVVSAEAPSLIEDFYGDLVFSGGYASGPYVVKITHHDGTYEEVSGNTNGSAISVHCEKFSTFGLCATPTSGSGDGGLGANKGGTSPKTGIFFSK